LKSNKETSVRERVDVVRVSFPGVNSVPDPTQIFSTWQWFTLDHVADTLIRYRPDLGSYEPCLSESWSFDGSLVVFKLRSDIKFSDGSPIEPTDVVASISRVLDLKRSTHFHVWKNISNLSAMKDSVSFDYEGDKELLFLFLSSPEASIWSKEDIDGKENFHPTTYSGVYLVDRARTDGLDMVLNRQSIRSRGFPRAPARVVSFSDFDRFVSLERIRSGLLDVFVGDYIPFSEFSRPSDKHSVLASEPVVLVYLLSLRDKAPKAFGADLLQRIWSVDDGSGFMRPATSILPPGQEGALSKQETLTALPKAWPDQPVSIAVPVSYVSPGCLEVLRDEFEKAGLRVTLNGLKRPDFFRLLANPEGSGFDYLLSGYVASDRYPVTQLKLITGLRGQSTHLPHETDVPVEEKVERIRVIQKDFLSSQLVAPLFYLPSLIVYRPSLCIGSQNLREADFQIWRMNEDH
jgi:Bacterial extracellular solute-binding proteins, family 5 Middle